MNTIIAKNRRARYDFLIKSTIEVGISLLGIEVKSLRLGQCNISDSYIIEHNNEMFLQNCSIPIYKLSKNSFDEKQYNPIRLKKLLLKKKEIKKYKGFLVKKGATIIPLSIYSNNKGLIKLEIALAEGKKLYDKRVAEKEKEWKKEKNNILREYKF